MCQFNNNQPLALLLELGVADVGQIGRQSSSPAGLKLFEAQAGTAAEYDKAAAEKYKAEIDTRMKTLEDEAGIRTRMWL